MLNNYKLDNIQLKDEIESLKSHERRFVGDVNAIVKENKSLQARLTTIKDTSPFIMVLIDSDNTLVRTVLKFAPPACCSLLLIVQ